MRRVEKRRRRNLLGEADQFECHSEGQSEVQSEGQSEGKFDDQSGKNACHFHYRINSQAHVKDDGQNAAVPDTHLSHKMTAWNRRKRSCAADAEPRDRPMKVSRGQQLIVSLF
jgi:hypothetical protein